MADGHGGARTPSRPAPASGPGALSRRTDGQPIRDPGGLPYGDGQELRTVQASAPMAGRPMAPGSRADFAAALPLPSNGSLFDPPPAGEPLTAGVPFGAGPGPEVLASSARTGPTRSKLVAALPMLARAAEKDDASPELRALVTYLRSQV